jgi:uncharacterized RDD family membrane protein YckC
MNTGLTSFSTDDDPAPGSRFQGNEEVDPVSAGVTDGPDLESTSYESADSWRGEVAARLQRYRTRRKPSSPRYPSLFLPFEAREKRFRSADVTAAPEGSTREVKIKIENNPTAKSEECRQESTALELHTNRDDHQHLEPNPELFAKVIEFPRIAAIPLFQNSELAEPVVYRPRIVEAPEVLPPPPALGGILIEPYRNPALGKRDEVDALSSRASIARRLLAACVDGMIVASALTLFVAIFVRMNLVRLNLVSLNLGFNPISNWNYVRGSILGWGAGLAAVAIPLWMAYQFLFVVYTGSTPGLRIAKSEIAKFDGQPLNRAVRRWRVLASFLSTFSAGLGCVWCFLDERRLCWHDRITHTYIRLKER